MIGYNPVKERHFTLCPQKSYRNKICILFNYCALLRVALKQTFLLN